MGRRRKSVAAFSLFAFQDIITSVSGIIIVMMLLLSLELNERKASPPTQSAATLSELRRAIEVAESDLAELQASAGTQDAMIAQLARTSAPELQAELREFETRIAETKQSIEQLKSAQANLLAEQKAIGVAKFDSQEQVDELQQLAERARQLQGTIDAEQQENRLLFSVPEGFREEGYLVVVQGSGISVAHFVRSEPPVRFEATRGLLGDSAVNQLFDWLESRQSPKLYLLVVIRPDGIDLFDEIEPRLKSKQIRFGFDLVGQHEIVLSPEKGAAP